MLPTLRALGRALCLVCLLALPAAWAGQARYPVLYVFGDSLSDTGNDYLATKQLQIVPAIPPSDSPHATYWQGRFTNGPVAAEYLWRLIRRRPNAELAPSLSDPTLQSKRALSFAFGGSTSAASTPTPMGFTVPGLLGQVDLFTTALGSRQAPAEALYMVWSGSNDYLQNQADSPYTVVGNITQAIRGLYAAGARHFLVPNLANLGITPMVQAQHQGPQFTQLSKQHNALLKSALAALERELRPIRIVTVDIYTLSEIMLSTGLVSADPSALDYLLPDSGASNCLVVNPAACVDAPWAGFLSPFLFWDLMHPTTQVHGAIGTAMFTALLTQR
ncbi:SGNH/GDSL hydrolase family protein [Pseudorhodoferax sp.]|uniref:SGNH/GDSL hydrolase family protein n=1 Tax=Pseudorhodoferax sp. TaxID=1993553 RepID=UPI0039E6321E